MEKQQKVKFKKRKKLITKEWKITRKERKKEGRKEGRKEEVKTQNNPFV